jgi:hypothetical protein
MPSKKFWPTTLSLSAKTSCWRYAMPRGVAWGAEADAFACIVELKDKMGSS